MATQGFTRESPEFDPVIPAKDANHANGQEGIRRSCHCERSAAIRRFTQITQIRREKPVEMNRRCTLMDADNAF
jgi:hypothetical protein